MDNLQICQGNSDTKFIEISTRRNDKFTDHQGKNNYYFVIFYTVIHAGATVAFLEQTPVKTIHHKDCPFLTDTTNRCISCNNYRKTLFALTSQAKVPKTITPSKYTNYRYLTNSEKNNKPKNRKQKAEHQINLLKLKLNTYAENNKIELDYKTHSDLLQIMHDHHNQVSHNSFQQLFWESQLNAINKKTTVRWHPTIIKWCIYLRQKSASAYQTLRSSCISLRVPSEIILTIVNQQVVSTSM